ncbi:MAG: MFS transporter [Deferrisomatales bacterium]|nr:MFS transporter [Deferrisomatales bacterium]
MPSPRDVHTLYATAFLRALSVGMVGVLLGIYLAKLDFGAAQIGLVVSTGLAGAALATLLVTLWGDRAGRRRVLFHLAVLAAAGTLAAALVSGQAAMAAAAFLGMLNGMGRDRGAALALEQAILPGASGEQGRTRAFAWYNVLQDAGHALGSLLAGVPAVLGAALPLGETAPFRIAVGLAGFLVLASGLLYLRLSPAAEAPRGRPRPVLSAQSRRILGRISALFAVDALAGGFLVTALLSYFFFERFGATPGVVAALFFAARLLNAVSHLGAVWLARRIGLVNTMVFTHIPSSLLLMTVPFAPSFGVAAVLFLLREGLVEMDVPTRQSYVMAVVRPEERTVASGVTHLVRVGAWAVAPLLAGALMQGVSLGVPLVIGSGMKVAYDLLLWGSFRRIKPPEEGG